MKIRVLAAAVWIALEGAAMLAAVAAIPAEAENALLLGYSAQRLALMAMIALPALAVLVVGLYGLLNPAWSARLYRLALSRPFSRAAGRVGCIAAIVFGAAALLTPGWFSRWAAYFERLQPLLVWAALLGLDAWALSLTTDWPDRKRHFSLGLQTQRRVLITSAIGLAVFLVAWLSIALSGLGLTPDTMFWNEAGVPLLGIQVLACLAVTYAAGSLLSKANSVRVDILVAVGVWLLACGLWWATPAVHSYFAPNPTPPNNVIYPYSDAAVYDVSAQYLLMGRGIGTVFFQDKPLYVLILAGLRAIAGQSYDTTILLQVALLAIMPVGMYFLGKTIANRPAGLLLALLAVFQQRNSLAATPFIQVSNSKLLLTEYPAATALVFATLAAFIWLRSPLGRPQRAVLSGGVFSLAVLIRPNAFLPLLVFGLVILAVFWRNWKRFFVAAALFGGAVLLTTVPWLMRIQPGFDEPYLVEKLRAIWQTRYAPQPQSQIEVPSADGGSIKLASLSAADAASLPAQVQESTPSWQFIPAHFLHNEIMALMTLPGTFSLQTVPETVQAPQWSSINNWYGALPFGSLVMLLVDLGLVAAGAGYSWWRWRFAGLVPAVLQVSYYLANGISRNSGARYLVPVDWVFPLYYGLGLLLVVTWLAPLLAPAGWPGGPLAFEKGVVDDSPAAGRKTWLKAAALAGLFLVIGLGLTFSDRLVPDQPLPKDNATVMQILQKDNVLNLDDQQLKAFLASDASIARIGRGLYPRYFWKDVGEPIPGGLANADAFPLAARHYARFTLALLAPENWYTAVLPYYDYSLTTFPDGADVAVVGCKTGEGTTIDAFLVAVLSDPPQIYTRVPEAAMTCPVADPGS